MVGERYALYSPIHSALCLLVLLKVVPDGFGVAYMTGFDGWFLLLLLHFIYILTTLVDYLQYTITSRKEMPNEEFVKEIAKAAEDLYNLHTTTQAPKAKL